MKKKSNHPLLVLDASSHALSVAWFDGIKAEYVRQSVDGKSEVVFQILQKIGFRGSKISNGGAIVVGTGPGSFTGNRIAVTAAKTLAHVLKIPLYGVYSTEFIAANSAPSNYPICVLMDAKRNSCFIASHDASGIPIGAPRLLGFGDVLSTLQPGTVYTGDMVNKMKELMIRQFGRISVVRNRTRWYPLPETMLLVARRLIKSRAQKTQPLNLTPTYLYPETCNVTLSKK